MDIVSNNKVRLVQTVLLCFCTTSAVDAKAKFPVAIPDEMILLRKQSTTIDN